MVFSGLYFEKVGGPSGKERDEELKCGSADREPVIEINCEVGRSRLVTSSPRDDEAAAHIREITPQFRAGSSLALR